MTDDHAPADYPALRALADQVQALCQSSGLPIAGFAILANHPATDAVVSDTRHRTVDPAAFQRALIQAARGVTR